MTTIIEAHFDEIHPELVDLTRDLHWERDPEKGVRILRTVLHSLRDLLKLDDAIAILMLLPHPMKALFIENWNTADLPSVPPEMCNFVDLIRKKAGKLAFFDFATPADTEKSIEHIFCYIQEKLDIDQVRELQRYLPAMVRPFLCLPSFAG
ncbi:DUF2267 domain-containing protein [Cytophagaceae bacterium DM2B3-1]|uniref:DUF2267 domain-containing protein n=2 Tax=Xanthocytophaga TaxID=3078918 RepID=A0AAE3QQ16_9BACT|nr:MULTISPECIES: DUF2267 domain-containing protein [Xanthocytophaga]MDJ1469084.1 DUF2267 domain-containing protein [Xanthocytophaga flavus]MDJ1481120.1 DUF2267 domain-containing protein [Xanthocytophaga flavus]MDJ1497370.1 DUF2267 domain-containing protein [Xanthocytophaga flavus]MDJ1504731.1 DUF2267 domain-containing protein [Xanthocytophaga agilis]